MRGRIAFFVLAAACGPDAGERAVLARRVELRYDRLTDGRLVTRVDLEDERARGTLVAVEPGSLDEPFIDESVASVFGTELGDGFGDNAVMYTVDDSERSGLWLARLAE